MQGRTEEALHDVARNISVSKEWRIYDDLDKSQILGPYSYSLETRVFYNATKTPDRIKLLNLYSDGVNPVNMIAIKDVFNRTLVYSDIADTAKQLAKRGFVPFIGHWESDGGFYTGISIAANHGISDPDVMAMLEEHKQMYAARISVDGLFLFPNL